jgi:drug/metabolite transporter (DMT)-like permease
MTLRVWIAFLALCLMWGIPYFFIKQAVLEMSPVWVAWGRIGVGAALLLPIAWKRGALRNIGKHVTALLAFAVVVSGFVAVAAGAAALSASLARW